MLKYLTFILLLCFSANLAAAEGDSAPSFYYSETCGHCHKVMNYLKQDPHPVIMKNVKNQAYRAELIGLGFRSVPVLVTGDDQRITGADRIIAYFRSHSH